MIDQAIGILISRRGGTPEEAFDALRTISQREHRKLSDVACHVVDEAARRARARHLNRLDEVGAAGQGATRVDQALQI